MSRYLKFWGTRGSCPVSGQEYAQFGGNTTCLEIAYDNACLIIDAGTGIRPLGEELMKQKKPIHLFFSHTHWDHVIGFPFFDPLYSPDMEIEIWAPKETDKNCREIFDHLLSEAFFPVRLHQLKAKIQFHSIRAGQWIQIGPLKVEFHQTHHPSTTLCFKIHTPHQVIGCCSDNEMCKDYHGDLQHVPEDPSLIQFFSGCDLLIHEAQYFPEEYRQKVGWGHSSLINAAALVQKANIKRWLVVHHDPKHTDDDLHRLAALSEKLFQENQISCRSEWIEDGRTMDLE